MEFLINNLGTILIAAAVIAILAAVIVNMVRKKKRGESSCGCGCSGCAMANVCHGAKENKSAD